MNIKRHLRVSFFMPGEVVVLTITEKQKAFVEEYLIDLNATRAYKAVYKSCKKDETARVNGSRLLTNANVSAYLAERQKELQERTEITQKRVIDELAAIAFADVADYAQVTERNGMTFVTLTPTGEIPANKRAAIAGIKQSAYGIEVKLYNKLDALDKLGRHLGIFKENDDDGQQEDDDGFIEALKGQVDSVWQD